MFQSIREKNHRKFVKSLTIFLTTSDEVENSKQTNSSHNCVYHVEILNLFDAELQLINTKPVLKIN